MTWPTTPINTTNLDAGSDQPALARSDLKDMADAVNAMIAYGDPYNPGSPVPIPISAYAFVFTSPTSTINAGTSKVYTTADGTMYEIYDTIGTSVSISGGITISSGTYLVETNLDISSTKTGRIKLTNISDTSTYLLNPLVNIGSGYRSVILGSAVVNGGVTLHICIENTDSTNGDFTVNNSYAGSAPDAQVGIIKIIKIA